MCNSSPSEFNFPCVLIAKNDPSRVTQKNKSIAPKDIFKCDPEKHFSILPIDFLCSSF